MDRISEKAREASGKRGAGCARGGAIVLAVLVTGSGAGCKTIRPFASDGHDLLENPGRSAAVRIPAGVGALVGLALSLPAMVVLLPTYFFEETYVTNSEGETRIPSDSTDVEAGSTREQGDIHIPLVLAPLDYGCGTGAAIFAWPFEKLSLLFREDPGPAPGTVVETQELPPEVPHPRGSFAARPPPTPGPAVKTAP
ncbi:MAG TPA: hypothetical protein VMT52_02580 [Planctomycetota bacterium]|nr:hypothetical protein [Planctomycetota bacterium]